MSVLLFPTTGSFSSIPPASTCRCFHRHSWWTRGTLTSIKYCIDRFNLLVTEGGYNLELGFLRNTFGVAILVSLHDIKVAQSALGLYFNRF